MKNLLSIFIFLSLLFSCESPKGEKAEVSEPKETKLPEPEALLYNLQTSASELTWIGRKPSGKHTGTIEIKEGDIEVLNGNVTGGNITIDMDEIEVRDLKSDDDSHMKLTEHLKSDDFFDVANHPYAKFEIIEVQPYKASEKEAYNQNNKAVPTGEYELNNPSHKITGNLTMRGKTLSITFPAYIVVNDEQVIAKANFVIDRTLWNVRYNEEANFKDKAQDKLIFNDVAIRFDILARPTNEIL
jgi:polyisoprenoid-binding protein YceI